MKTIFVFICQDGSGAIGYTDEISGRKLPSDGACKFGWKFFKQIEISEAPFSLIGANSKEVLNAVTRQGYYLSESSKNRRKI